MKTHQRGIEALESVVPGNSQAAFGGGPGEKGWKQYLACGLSYFGLAFTGPKVEAEEIKRQLSIFLREELGLTLSPEKTLITHARRDAAKFLGYEITTLHSDTKQSLTRGGVKRRSINGKTGL